MKLQNLNNTRDRAEVDRGGGALIVNADDWGRNRQTTDRIFECVSAGAVSSVSAMVFMEDSQRAATIARIRGVDAGLHLNFTTDFSSPAVPLCLAEHQQKLVRYLRSRRLAQALFHPGLATSFRSVVEAQLEEFSRLYGDRPRRIDGHHHMHLCTNVLLGRLLPAGTIVRRNFSFARGEKSLGNRLYRNLVDGMLARRHRTTDLFFSLPPLSPSRLESMFSLAAELVVEVETHPVNSDEYAFLTSGALSKWSGSVELSSFSRYFK